ncbi:lipase/acylhydrolase [Latilactobacillus sakei]|nr:SGNH/GDSL hydrolase family protein [Latilactobacillus sakei]KRK72337.1 hypothetical protein FD49_GL000444 [Latilactobacillus sakei subsp. sakei DSM 20017 = JCM 1157]GEL35434.1 lipase/acylhydrolase [Latilactobacillus sakei subsp. sakei]MCP8852875.1 SGNH/GDSL hydrolase family protein [Latilactobacillus sakei]BAX66882.1 extracellular lysophospholipase [Latilactobacillus sakei subsp. sakei DSM 20017 = JCM 1157]GEA76089.1 lipase/acylhydrolase [Latilactobacillus sakei]
MPDMKKIRQLLIDLGIFAGVLLVVFIVWQLLTPRPMKVRSHQESVQKTKVVQPKKVKKTLHLVAVGDSLTHGVGDEQNKEGYVSRIAAKIKTETGHPVATENYGVTGDTSVQIEKRVRTQPTLQANLKKADIITLTVGGNDLMAVLQNNFLDLDQKQITAGQKAYQTHLMTLFRQIRQQNPTAPIFVMGVYNPFYVYFPEITGMSKAVTAWNKTVKEVANDFESAYYINSDRLLTHGDGHYVKQTKSLAKMDSSKLQKTLAENEHLNPYISDDDHFHPNQKGYQLITNAFWQQMNAHQKDWTK